MSANRFTEPLSLEGFVRYFLAQDFAHMGAHDFYDYGNVLSLVLYRDARWQAELFILRPGVGFPREHRHPDVDSYEYILSERVPLIVNGRDVTGGPDGRGTNMAATYPVSSLDWHGVGDVPQGGSFLSLQEWKNGRRPTSAGKNWEGAPVSEIHRRMLRERDSIWIKTVRHAFTGLRTNAI